MLTAAQAADVLNEVESRILDSLNADAALKPGGTLGIASVHVKSLPKGKTVWTATIPCLVVMATSPELGPDATCGVAEVVVGVVVDYVNRSGDRDAGMNAAQKAVSSLVAWVDRERHDMAKGFDLLMTDGDGTLVGGVQASSPEWMTDEGNRPGFAIGSGISFRVSLRYAR